MSRATNLLIAVEQARIDPRRQSKKFFSPSLFFQKKAGGVWGGAPKGALRLMRMGGAPLVTGALYFAVDYAVVERGDGNFSDRYSLAETVKRELKVVEHRGFFVCYFEGASSG